MVFVELLRALLILVITWTQGIVVLLNLNQYGIFQTFVDIEFYETNPPKKDIVPVDPYEPDLFV